MFNKTYNKSKNEYKYNLKTSLNNYIDPRIVCNYCNKHKLNIEATSGSDLTGLDIDWS